jgi:four helix bundle protein
MSGVIHSHKELIVWQKAMDLVIEVYKLTDKFPQREMYGLSSQIRRAAVSVPSNIAEGRGRNSRKDFIHFIRIAYGSASELETQLLIARRLNFIKEKDSDSALSLLSEVAKMLYTMLTKLEANS